MAGAYIRKRERKDGVVYLASVDLGKDPLTGKRRERSETFSTRREAKAALARWQTEIGQGTFVDRSTQTVGEMLDYWMETHVKHHCSESTYVNYGRPVRLHLVPALGHLPVQKLTPAELQRFYADRLTAGAGRRTLELCHLCLHRALDMAMGLGLVGRNVADLAKPPKRPTTEHDVWSREEVRRFLAVAQGSHYGPIWLLMATTGMRRGEALGLRWRDVNLESGVIAIKQTLVSIDGRMVVAPPKKGHGGRSRRSIPLVPGMVAALHEHQTRQAVRQAALGPVWVDSGIVFTTAVGTPINARNLDREFKRFIAQAQVPPLSIHSVRHSVATLAVASGEDVRTIADLLGHDPRVLMTTYAHVLAHRKVEVSNRIGGMVLGNE